MLRIAYISYEHPAGIPTGGIGTYVNHMASVMQAKGHEVEVFSGASKAFLETDYNGYRLYLIPTMDKHRFRHQVLPVFSQRQYTKPFDIVESPEYGADGLEIKRAFPALPLVIKLHTPSFLISNLNGRPTGLIEKMRFIVGGLRRFRLNHFYWRYNKYDDPEYNLFRVADGVSSPSAALVPLVYAAWGNSKIVEVIPNPYPIEKKDGQGNPYKDSGLQILFVGKLEKRKGVLELMRAIPPLLKKYPGMTFHFVGSSADSPVKGVDMERFMEQRLKTHAKAVRFLGFTAPSAIRSAMDDCDICIIPSLWENFPYVCLEAMAACKAVIGTNNGGMADMIINGETGLLIDPGSPDAIIDAISYLAGHVKRSRMMGLKALETVLQRYSAEVVGELTETFYRTILADS